jgi:hypothetical protein
VGKKWSIRISQIAPVAKQYKPEVKAPAPLPQAAPSDDEKIIQLMQNPNAVIPVGTGDMPVFNRPLTGPEFAEAIKHDLTSQKIFNSIESSLNRQGFNKNVNYSPEQLKAFQNKLNSDLVSEYGGILRFLNGDYLKSE